jgi:predicted hydrocarbon binding protein
MIIEKTSRGTSQIGEFLLLGVEEIIGHAGLNAVINMSQMGPGSKPPSDGLFKRMDYADVAAMSIGLEKMYGPRGGHGIAQRAGRAGFKYLLRQNGTNMGITDLNFRLLPVPVRLKSGMEALGALMAKIGDEQVTVTEDDLNWTWSAQACPLCWGRTAHEPVCHFTVGLLQEYFAWASGGRVYSIHEVSCLASGGAACLIQIEKKALD